MVRSAALIAASLALAIVPASVHAHGAMGLPKVAFKDISNKNAPSASQPGPSGPYTGNDGIKDLAEKAGSKCGKTDANAPVQPIPADGNVVFDISAVHIGPCEVWLDETKVVSAKDCWKEHPDKKIKVDFSSCKSGPCLLRWVWMATHTSPWEFYDNCVRVGGGGGSGGDNNTPSKPTTNAPANTTAPVTQAPAPAPTTVKPTPGTVKPADEDDYNDDDKPADDGKTPGDAGKPSSGSCVRGKGGDKTLDAWCAANCAMGFCPESHCEKC